MELSPRPEAYLLGTGIPQTKASNGGPQERNLEKFLTRVPVDQHGKAGHREHRSRKSALNSDSVCYHAYPHEPSSEDNEIMEKRHLNERARAIE